MLFKTSFLSIVAVSYQNVYSSWKSLEFCLRWISEKRELKEQAKRNSLFLLFFVVCIPYVRDSICWGGERLFSFDFFFFICCSLQNVTPVHHLLHSTFRFINVDHASFTQISCQTHPDWFRRKYTKRGSGSYFGFRKYKIFVLFIFEQWFKCIDKTTSTFGKYAKVKY